MTPKEEAKYKTDKKLIYDRINANARETNKRIKLAYDRGVKVCRNLKNAGYPDGNGCPRPKPKYLDYFH
jgi:hypothetical protein